MNRAYT